MRLIDADLLKKNCKITEEFDNHFQCVDLITLGQVIDNQPALSETEIIRKAFERALKRLEREKRKYEKAEVEYKDTFSERNYRIRKYTAEALIEIVKEECEISE